jgi:hypothetical protein
LSARSSVVALVALAGCDLVFGLDDKPEPCPLASFDGAAPTTITAAQHYSIDWDQTFAVISQEGASFEMALPDGAPTPTDLGLYMTLGLSLNPEANALFYTIMVEPMELKGALRGDEGWRLDAVVPRGTFAGTPSADVFGPRRVMIRERELSADVQEFEDTNGVWKPIGAPLPIPGMLPPSLTPNGLTMVYAATDAEGAPMILAAQRSSVDAEFSAPTILLRGDYRAPQLCGMCQQLYVISGPDLVRFDR